MLKDWSRNQAKFRQLSCNDMIYYLKYFIKQCNGDRLLARVPALLGE